LTYRIKAVKNNILEISEPSNNASFLDYLTKLAFKQIGNVSAYDSKSKPFSDGGFSYARFADKAWVVLGVTAFFTTFFTDFFLATFFFAAIRALLNCEVNVPRI